jgi:hypothetical protein
MKSRRHVKCISVSEGSQENVLFEGFLGKLESLSLIEGEMLEIEGANGVLRIDIKTEELTKQLLKKEQEKTN